MTAEVAILNKSAIALAADSAVTLGGEHGKIYNTVNKLFTLSKRHPVGVMIYGNAEFMGVPFETIIKLYRERRRDRSAKTIDLYASDFKKFLRSKIFVSTAQEDANVSRIWESTFDSLRDEIRLRVRDE